MNRPAYKVLAVGSLLILIGCTQLRIQTKIRETSVQPLTNSNKVIVFGLNQTIPGASKLLGNSRIVGAADTSCGIEQLIKVAEKQARKIGGNIVKVTKIIKPRTGIYNLCYEITADIYYHEHIEDVATSQDSIQDSITRSKFRESTNFAIFNVYRPGNPSAALVGYDVYLNDSIICKTKNNSKYEIRLYKPGKMEISVKPKFKSGVMVDVKLGEEYFLKFEVAPIPRVYLIDKARGRTEYEETKERD